MLAANSKLDVFPRLAPALGRDFDQLADAFAVDRDERVDGENALVGINAEEARRIVARNAENGLGEIVGAEGKEFGGLDRKSVV